MLPPSPSAPEGTWMYMRATIPSGDEEDIKAMRLEEEINPESPQDLFDRIPTATPSVLGGMLRHALPEEMSPDRMACLATTFKILDVPAFEMEIFPWK